MLNVSQYAGHTFFKKKMPDHRIVLTIFPDNSTQLVAIAPNSDKLPPAFKRSHETRAHALCYVANALNIQARL